MTTYATLLACAFFTLAGLTIGYGVGWDRGYQQAVRDRAHRLFRHYAPPLLPAQIGLEAWRPPQPREPTP